MTNENEISYKINYQQKYKINKQKVLSLTIKKKNGSNYVIFNDKDQIN